MKEILNWNNYMYAWSTYVFIVMWKFNKDCEVEED